MAAPKKQESRFSSLLEVGPMKTRGDLSSSKEPLSTKMRNCLIRRGRVVGRDRFTQKGSQFADDINGSDYVRKFFVWNQRSAGYSDTNAAETLFLGAYGAYQPFGRSKSWVLRTSAGTWTQLSVCEIFSLTDYNGAGYFSIGPANTETESRGRIYRSIDGTSFTSNPFGTVMFSELLLSFGGRILAAGCRFSTEGEVGTDSFMDHHDNTAWTVAGTGSAQPVKDGTTNVVTWTLGHATDNTLTYTKNSNTMYTTAAQEKYYTVVQWVRAVDDENIVPLKMTIEDPSGNAIATRDFDVQPYVDEPEWIPIQMKVLFPASTAFTVKLTGGNGSSGGATVGQQVELAIDHGLTYGSFYGVNIYPGTFLLDVPLSEDQIKTSGYDGTWVVRDAYVYWSDPLTPDEWIATNYIHLDDKPGKFTSIHTIGGKIVVTREDAIYSLRPILGAEGVDQAFVFESSWNCDGPKSQNSCVVVDDVLFYIGEDNIYAFNFQPEGPEALIDASIRDEMFPVVLGSDALVRQLSIAHDPKNDEILFVSNKPATKGLGAGAIGYDAGLAGRSKCWVFSLESKVITGYLEAPCIPGTNTEPPVGDYVYVAPPIASTSYMVFYDVQWAQDRMNFLVVQESPAEVYEAYHFFSDGEGQDNGTSTNTGAWSVDIWAEYRFKPLESEVPRSIVTIQRVGIKHNMETAGVTLKYRLSTDRGATWKYVETTLSRVSTGDAGGTRTCRYFIHKTGEKFLYSVVYNGAAGEDNFNIESGMIDGILRGRENQRPHDTKVGTGTE